MKIFASSPGRSGTRFFANVFSVLTDIQSYHERWPKCINVVNEDINNHAGAIHEKTRKVLDCKIENIKKNSIDGNYFESSHMFIKTFVNRVVREFPDDVYCIHIERDVSSYLDSFTRRGKRDNWSIDFQLQPHWKGNILRMDGVKAFYPMIVWNWYEVKARFNNWKPYFKKTYHFDFNKINDASEWKKLFNHFEIETIPFDELPLGLDRHQSNITEAMRLNIHKHIKENWNQEGNYRFITDYQKMGIDEEKNYEL